MKIRAIFWAASIVILGLASLRADDPDDAYVNFYSTLKQADKLSTNGTPQEALLRYQQAEVALRNLQKNHPDYHHQLIQYREGYVERRIEQLESSNRVGVARSTAAPQGNPQPAANPPKTQK